MIIELILNMIYWCISVLVAPLSLIFQPLGSFAGLIELFAYASIFIPVAVLGQCLIIWATYYIAVFSMTVINWLIAKVPTID